MEDEITHIWQIICNCTLDNSRQSQSDLEAACADLISEMKTAVSDGLIPRLWEILVSHQIPSMLVSFANADIPTGFVSETITFFIACLTPPLSALLKEEFVYGPLNSLIQSRPRVAVYENLLGAVCKYLQSHPDDIRFFILGDSTSPLIDQIVGQIPKGKVSTALFVLQLITCARELSVLDRILCQNSEFLKIGVQFLRDYIVSRRGGECHEKCALYVNFWMDAGSPELVRLFSEEFERIVTVPFVVKANADDGLRASLYILCLLNSVPLVSPVIRFLESALPGFLDSDSQGTHLLAIQCLTLLLDHVTPTVGSASDLFSSSSSLMRLLPGDWFVFSDLNAQIEQARAQVGAAMSAEKTVRRAIAFDLSPVLLKAKALFGRFFENSLSINLALTDFFAVLLTVVRGAFAEDGELGLYQMLEIVCTTAKLRIGSKDGTIDNIKKAYHMVAAEPSVGPGSLFVHLVVLLEFLKELNSITQSQSLLTDRDGDSQ
jgi:hypothetical protein